MIYIASPYTNQDKTIRAKRFEITRDYCASLAIDGIVHFSPIVYGHPLAEIYNFKTDISFWWRQDLGILSKCSEVHVLSLPNWQDSKGLAIEIAFAEASYKDITYITEDEVQKQILKWAYKLKSAGEPAPV